jgi:hypothetical protein
MVAVMADASHSTVASHSTMTLEPPVSGGLVAGLKSFVGHHGGARAVIEYVGRRGARIVLVGEDGAWSDQFAPACDIAREACVKAGVVVENSWERELIENMRPSGDLWRSMSRRSLSR